MTIVGSAELLIRPNTAKFGADLEKDVTGHVQSTAGKITKILGAAFVAAGVLKFGKDSVAAFSEAEQAQNKLNAAFEKFPKLGDLNADALRKVNTELAKKTKFDDDATASGQAVLAQFGLTGQQIKQLTPLLQDYAARTGTDLPSAAQNLGRAFLGNTRALKQVGIEFKATGDRGKDFTAITGLLRDKVGGFAEKEGKTFQGRMEILHNQFGEIQESVGAALVPALQKLANVVLDIISFLQNLSPAGKAVLAVIVGLAAAVVVIIQAYKVWTAVTKAFTIVQTALDVVLVDNPIGLVVIAIAALVAGIVIAYKNSETFRGIVQKLGEVFKGLLDIIVGVFEWVRDHWELLLGILGGPIGLAVVVIVKHFDTIKGVIVGVVDWVRDHWQVLLALLTGPIGLAVLAIAKHFDAIVGFVTGALDKIKGFGLAVFHFFRDDVIQPIIDTINDAIDAFNKLPGPNIGKVGGDAAILRVVPSNPPPPAPNPGGRPADDRAGVVPLPPDDRTQRQLQGFNVVQHITTTDPMSAANESALKLRELAVLGSFA